MLLGKYSSQLPEEISLRELMELTHYHTRQWQKEESNAGFSGSKLDIYATGPALDLVLSNPNLLRD